MIERLRQSFLDFTVRLAEEVDREALEYRAKSSSFEANRRVAGVILGAILCLLAIRFLGNSDDVDRLTWLVDAVGFKEKAKQLKLALTKGPDARFNVRIFWCISRLTFYGIIPMLLTKLVLREKLSDFGFAPRKAGEHLGLYVLMFAIVLPFVIYASFGPSFQAKYPYYRPPASEPFYPKSLLAEVMYASQFVALEYFFRGYLIHGLRRVMGYSALFVPLLPYVMIHYGKPPAEAIGSAITGFVLGTVSLRTRSVMGGAGIHIAVALSMDFLAMWHSGRL